MNRIQNGGCHILEFRSVTSITQSLHSQINLIARSRVHDFSGLQFRHITRLVACFKYNKTPANQMDRCANDRQTVAMQTDVVSPEITSNRRYFRTETVPPCQHKLKQTCFGKDCAQTVVIVISPVVL